MVLVLHIAVNILELAAQTPVPYFHSPDISRINIHPLTNSK